MLPAFDVSVGVLVRGLTRLKVILRKGEEHGTPLTACLVDGMQDLGAQVHWASEGSWLALQRVLGAPQGPATPASETTFDGLQASLDRTIERLLSIDPAALEAGLQRAVELPWRGGTKTYRGDRFLLEFALPNFFFHLTLAYAILRQQGVPLEKGDFMGS